MSPARDPRSERPFGTTKEYELQFMLALKTYIDAVITDSLAKHGIDAVTPLDPTRLRSVPKRWVYFIQGEDGGNIKIGVANDPEKRLGELQRTSPVKLRIVARVPGEEADEKRLHSLFAKHRLHGEWFEPAEPILSLIENLEKTA